MATGQPLADQRAKAVQRAVTGSSLSTGSARVVEVDEALLKQTIRFQSTAARKRFDASNIAELFPLPPFVEFIGGANTYHYNPGHRRREYVAFAALAKRCLPEDVVFGSPVWGACATPSPDALHEIMRFVEIYGLPKWGGLHACREESFTLSVPGIEPESRPPSTWITAWFRPAGRDICSTSWILRESVLLARALTLKVALEEIRNGTGAHKLERLWEKRRGSPSRLFGDGDAYDGLRLEHMVALSLSHLAGLVNTHIHDAHVVASLERESWPRPKGGTFRASWLRATSAFESPLTGLWLRAFEDMVGTTTNRRCRCGVEFAPARVDQQYCSARCGSRFRNQAKRTRAREIHLDQDGSQYS
jgi:hypothetical protein